jgi:two-component system response regulator DevR
MITVFLVDAHRVVRRGIADLLTADPELVVIGEAASSAQALARIPVLKPDVAVLDVRLPDGNGIELCRELLSRMPALRCLMLTSIADDQAMLDAIVAGASGYVVKDFRGLELAEAVHDVGAGNWLLDSRGAATLMAKLRSDANEKNGPFARLTNQERTLLALLGEGLTDRQIAERMFLAEKTGTNYVSRLLTKLGVARRTQAAVLATTMPHNRPEYRQVPRA